MAQSASMTNLETRSTSSMIKLQSSLFILEAGIYPSPTSQSRSISEARIWNNVFERAEKMVGIEKGSIRATVLIETLPAVFQMDEIFSQIPIRDDPEANQAALELVKKDKLREVRAGHDGTWAAHLGLIPAIVEVLTDNMGNSPNLIKTMKREDASSLTEVDLLQIPRGVRIIEGLRLNTRVRIHG
ncbi:malate synthase, glyoxysomal-like [Rutidosis leptorrhynchoides]|uniref:malate synthase, glyoxysomal-like n=1 Tax=Rutidosis leptorrhynchoides TaxID=125765 RepID=UPI003A999F8F